MDLLPTPWRGFMMAGFAAAYMSTVATQLNWGASYLVNDFYRRFLKKDGTEHHFVAVSRAATIVLFLLSVLVTWQLNSVEQAWKFLIGLGAGTGLVYILRWYWWRVNAWSEITAMVASFVVFTWLGGALGLVLSKLGIVSAPDALTPAFIRNAGSNADAMILLVTVVATTIVWLVATYVTKPEPPAVLDAFYRRVRPGGPGWRTVAQRLGFGAEQMTGGRLAWANWLAGVVAVYATLFGIGKIIFGEMAAGLLLLLIALSAFIWIAKALNKADREADVILESQKA